jgi:hypothetical protein
MWDTVRLDIPHSFRSLRRAPTDAIGINDTDATPNNVSMLVAFHRSDLTVARRKTARINTSAAS